MIESFLFSLVLYMALWPYFIALGVMNFRKDPNAMEDHLPGRPARRTIGRKNDDVSKALFYILVGYAVISLSLYGLLDYKDFLPDYALRAIAFCGFAVAMIVFSPANRLMHAYVTMGHIAVSHIICSLATFVGVVTVIYGYRITMADFLGLGSICLGAMLIFFAKPLPSRKKSSKQSDEEI